MSTYPLKLADHLLEEARRAAAEDNVPLNQLLSTLIAEGIGHRRAMTRLKTRAERGDPDAALAILSKIPPSEPEADDRL